MYAEFIKQGVHRHEPCEGEDLSSWPPTVAQLVQSLKNALRLPRSLKSGPVSYTTKRALALLDQVRAADVATTADRGLWDDTNEPIDSEMEQRLRVVSNTALVDCARIQAVVEAECLSGTLFPKESFLVVLVRNAMLEAHAWLSSLEDVPVVLPRHISGEDIPILSYMTKHIYVPLIVSVCQEMPIEKSGSDLHHESSGDEASSVVFESFQYSPPTLSEFLDRGNTPEEVEQEQEDGCLLSRFEAYFLAYPPSAVPPSMCHIPVLCMADAQQLPVLMSSLLYQRRVWHISDPLIGLEFSKYDTTIRLFVGWLEDSLSFDRVLPRVHLGQIATPLKLDLSSPSVALVISQLICDLKSHVLNVHDITRRFVSAVVSETQSYTPLSWRIDTDVQRENSESFFGDKNTRDTIIKWVQSQKYSEEECQSGSAASMPLQSPRLNSTRSISPLSIASRETSRSIPEIREPYAHSDDIPTFCSRLSCSTFAATTEKDDHRVFCWMFDRRVIPQCIPSDQEFREVYTAMTDLIWPETWRVRGDLPLVDVALEPYVEELLENVAELRAQPNLIKCIPPAEFPVDLRILEQSFSAIFQASRRSREKKELHESVYEAAWRHDHDRLLFDFFIRLVQLRQGDPQLDGRPIAHLEDPLSRPILETTLRFPKSENLTRDNQEERQMLIYDLITRKPADLRNWLRSRNGPRSAYIQDARNSAYVLSQWSTWTQVTNTESEAQMISKLGQLPSTGRCDALGRLLVELPDISSEDISLPALVVQSARKHGFDSGRGRKNVKVSTSGFKSHTYSGGMYQASTATQSSSLTVPEVSAGVDTKANEMRYTIPSSSLPTPIESLNKEPKGLVDSVDTLASRTQRLRLGSGATYLELPILTVEYKGASDDLTKGTNQIRMYLTASVKFLQAIGITNVPVYGIQTDGPIVVVPAAVVRDDNFVYLFERLVERLDISTPLGAWHYATILCRLAKNHAELLGKRFEEVREHLVASLLRGDGQVEGWTIDDQIARLKAENRAKSPTRGKSAKKSVTRMD